MSFPQGPGNGNNPNPNNNRNNGNPFTNPFNHGNNGNNGKGNKENRPIWQSPWLWGAVLVVMVVLMFQMFAGGGTKTIDTKDGFALINQGKATYAEITDNKQVVRLELKNDYTKKNAETGKVVIATKEAVTLFNKKGTEVEQEREGNIRRNTVYSRKYYLAAMTNEAKAVKIITGSAAVTTDETVTTSKTYYAKSGIGYVKVTPGKNDNPKTKGWYEITAA